MTTGDEAKARELLANAKALLLDFDGPICSVFAGLPAPVVAEQLRVVLADGGHTDLPESIATTGDPFDVFRYAATLGDEEARYVEAAFTALEVEAIATAEPTPGAHDLIHAWHRSGRPLAIVSNNSQSAVELFLDLQDFRHKIAHISARTNSDPESLKPNVYLLQKALENTGIAGKSAAFIGDSTTDITAGQKMQVRTIGYANKWRKVSAMQKAQATAVVDSIAALMEHEHRIN